MWSRSADQVCAAAVLLCCTRLARKAARKKSFTVEELKGRGKGSHRVDVIRDENGKEVGRFGLTGHGSKDVSWEVLREIEDGMAHLFGDKWMEK